MKPTIKVPTKRRIESLDNIFDDPTIRSIGVIADVNQGKTNTLNAIVKAIKARYTASIWTCGLRMSIDGVEQLNSVGELETIYNSVVIVDELPDFFDITNPRENRMFEKSMRKVFHSNNIIIICALPRNFNKNLGAMLQGIIFKQCTLSDFIQRSPTDMAIKSYTSTFGSPIQKGTNMLTMPKDLALYHEIGSKHWHELDVEYIKEADVKQFNPDILRPKKGK
jgi:hypothetical protein